MTHPYLDSYRFIPFAHRGGTSHAPENTMRAFQNAIDMGFVFLETDIHASSDGVLFAFHDNDLSRTCGINANINELTADQIDKCLVDGTDPVPRLSELIDSFPNARFNIDCKADYALKPLINYLQKQEIRNRVCIGSFSDKRLHALRQEFGKSICTSSGPKEVALIRIGKVPTKRKIETGEAPRCLQIPPKQGPIRLITSSFVDRCTNAGLPIHVWTIDDPEEMTQLIQIGVSGLMTDRPAVLKTVLEQRNMWPH